MQRPVGGVRGQVKIIMRGRRGGYKSKINVLKIAFNTGHS